ncbi:NAD-dependent epimerase/dehydratase family protein [Pedobacter sp. BS3]|uniref:NAD-dependent epimerase/dehydratase family protein n=1 Tax=Pedobacter sp. BS3 TaxID=2567937 RepID=UPI0011EE9BF0|nr:NAD-dependent epimerase/dehydratase family protein [Pedobacter sp. BS3]TZF81862.1 NAD-dependent epimerase/dehydratase family protein [Pedobacter sp. BS3]
MKILLAGASGFIGRALLHELQRQGYELIYLCRDKRFMPPAPDNVQYIEADLLRTTTLRLPVDVDVAYYLRPYIAPDSMVFNRLQFILAENFIKALEETSCRQLISLTGITTDRQNESSRINHLLLQGNIPCTIVKTAPILAAESVFFTSIHTLVKKLPIIILPGWLKNSLQQPIALQDLVACLTGILLNTSSFNRDFDVCGPDVMTYKDLLLTYARLLKLSRTTLSIPVPGILWTRFLGMLMELPVEQVRSLNRHLRHTLTCDTTSLQQLAGITPTGFEQALQNLAVPPAPVRTAERLYTA